MKEVFLVIFVLALISTMFGYCMDKETPEQKWAQEQYDNAYKTAEEDRKDYEHSKWKYERNPTSVNKANYEYDKKCFISSHKKYLKALERLANSKD